MPLPDSIQTFIDRQADAAPERYDDLRVVVFNGTTKRSPETSHTDGLLAIPQSIFAALGVRCDEVRTVDRTIPPGLWPDMREHGYEQDEFPDIYRSLVSPPTSSSWPARSGSETRAHRHARSSSASMPTPVRSTTQASGRTTARSAAR